MKNKISSKKNLIIFIVVILVLIVFGYWYFNQSTPVAESILSNSTATSSDSLLLTLNQLRALSLDNSVFTAPSFEALSDNTVTLPTVLSGRPNPFAPIPGLIPLTGQLQNGTSILH